MKLLGQPSEVVSRLDRLTGGFLLAFTGVEPEFFLGLFDAKAEFARLSRDASAALQDRRLGLGRYRRTQRVAAAHAVIVLTGFFDTVRQGGRFLGPGLSLFKAEQARLAGAPDASSNRLGDLAEHLLRAKLPCPGPTQPTNGSWSSWARTTRASRSGCWTSCGACGSGRNSVRPSASGRSGGSSTRCPPPPWRHIRSSSTA